MANYIDRHFGPQGLRATSLHPGGIWTPLQKYIDPEMLKRWQGASNMEKFIKSTPAGRRYYGLGGCGEGVGGHGWEIS
jgi:NAD(P)-dependent dehydrogenase (short-subunit alcohol dehydrogenase family)